MASQNPNPSQARKREGEHDGEAQLRESHLRERSSDFLKDTIDEFKERGDDLRTLVSEYAKEKPFKALGIALLTGMVLAIVMKR
jgi:ElaB/YqjD/DUF883 family membrane-anchored ribosome-binding protein